MLNFFLLLALWSACVPARAAEEAAFLTLLWRLLLRHHRHRSGAADLHVCQKGKSPLFLDRRLFTLIPA